MPRALISGIAGQDGSYLAELLLAQGWEVHGTVRPHSGGGHWRLAGFEERLHLHPADLPDSGEVLRLVEAAQPDACWHLTGARKPSANTIQEKDQLAGNLAATQNLLQALYARRPACAFVFAGTSEMFGTQAVAPQSEATPFRPETLYAIAKTAGAHLVAFYRREKGMRASTAILFNHESPRRGPEFVTRQISLAAARIRLGTQKELRLGDLGARRDWGHARSFAAGLAAIAGLQEPLDLVLATGVLHSVQDFVEAAFGAAGLDWSRYVREDPAMARPRRTGVLQGDSSLAAEHLGWWDRVPFVELAREMVLADLERESR